MSGGDVLRHLQAHLHEWVHNQALREVSGIDDVPRLLRTLRQRGWDIESRGDGYCRLVSAVQGAARGTRTTVSSRDRFLALHKGNHRCQGCGRGVQDGVKLVVDHVVPVDWGGSNAQENLQALCEACNHGKQAWVASTPADVMRTAFAQNSVKDRIETLFDLMPDRDVPSTLVRLVSGNALDWQRALRKVRQRSGKAIVWQPGRSAYRYTRDVAAQDQGYS